MLTKEERKKIANNFYPNNSFSLLKKYEDKFNLNYLEAYYTANKTENYDIWKKIIAKSLYNNFAFFELNKKKDIDYFIIPTRFSHRIIDYLNLLRTYIYDDKNTNSVLILSNLSSRYQKIIELCNEKGIMCILFSNNPEDKYLDYSNVFVQIINNPLEIIKRMPLFELENNSIFPEEC